MLSHFEKEKCSETIRQAQAILKEPISSSTLKAQKEMLLDLVKAIDVTVGVAVLQSQDVSLNMATADIPLSDATWLDNSLDSILEHNSTSPSHCASAVKNLIDLINPVTHYHDWLGSPDAGSRPHLRLGAGAKQDPSYYFSAVITGDEYQSAVQNTWLSSAHTFFGHPLTLEYTGLDTNTSYKVRLV